VVGNSGSGKSTVASALAARLRVPWVELDALYHQAGWQPLPAEEFRARVAATITADGWVVDGNRERWHNLFTTNPEHSVLAWAWHQHPVYRHRYTTAITDRGWAHLRFLRLRSRTDLRNLL
jgi:adenylate kinase family enzyme